MQSFGIGWATSAEFVNKRFDPFPFPSIDPFQTPFAGLAQKQSRRMA